MMRALIATGLVVLLASPAFASDFYLVQNVTTKRCKVVETQPDGKKWVTFGTTPYPTLEAARAAKRTNTGCVKANKS